jgi:hypothetical protein
MRPAGHSRAAQALRSGTSRHASRWRRRRDSRSRCGWAGHVAIAFGSVTFAGGNAGGRRSLTGGCSRSVPGWDVTHVLPRSSPPAWRSLITPQEEHCSLTCQALGKYATLRINIRNGCGGARSSRLPEWIYGSRSGAGEGQNETDRARGAYLRLGGGRRLGQQARDGTQARMSPTAPGSSRSRERREVRRNSSGIASRRWARASARGSAHVARRRVWAEIRRGNDHKTADNDD